MSLFKSRELWSTLCGKDESYDNGCMVVADLLSQGFDCLIVGSQNGLLRIFQPEPETEIDAAGYRATDLLIEMQLSNPVLQVNVGKLVSGTQSLQIGVLHPRSIAVYSLVSISGSAQHGDQYHLVMAYEHPLSKSAFSFVIGPFGGVKGRDFLCVQSLDGELVFFEQETYLVSRILPCFLLPSPFAYIASSDSFVVLNANWMLDCFRYEILADTNRKVLPWWSLNLGEPAVDIQVVTAPTSKASIFVLGERNLFCIKEGGSLEMVRRLQFTPCCVHPYITEPEHNVMVLVVADTATLLVYDSTSLCWSSQLPFIPVSIARINLKCVRGLVALISEEGEIVVCYLGTEPAVFVAPPLSNKALTYDELQRKLFDLQREIDSASQTAAVQVDEGHELKVAARTLSAPDPSECQLLVTLSPAAALGSAQVTVTVMPPLVVEPATHHLPAVCSEVEVLSLVSFSPTHSVPLLSVDAHIVVVYQGPGGNLRVLQTTAVLPTVLVLQPAAPGKEGEHKIVLSLSQPAVSLNQLFIELSSSERWEAAGCTESVAGLAHRSAPHCCVTVVLGRSTPRYRLQSDSAAALCLVVTQLTARLEGYYTARSKNVTMSFQAGSLPMAPLMSVIDTHIELRNKIKDFQEKLSNQTTQYRAIERRLLSKLREKTVQPLVGLDKLLADTYQLIVSSSHAIEINQEALESCSCELACVLRLVLVLARMCDTTSIKDWTDLAAATSYVMHSSENQGWEEVCERGVSYLLSTSLAKSVRDHQRATVDPLRDSARFKKHVSVAVDRVVAGTSPQARPVSPIMEGEENGTSNTSHDSRRQSNDGNSVSLKLLPSREALHSYGQSSQFDKEEELEDDEDLV